MREATVPDRVELEVFAFEMLLVLIFDVRTVGMVTRDKLE